MARSRSGLAFLILALVALAMLSFALVRSDVMVVSMALPVAAADADQVPVDDAMPGMRMDDDRTPATSVARHHRPDAGHDRTAACPFCSAVAHLPLPGFGPATRRIVAIAFVRFGLPATCGARAPPLVELRARGPPVDPLSA